MEDLQSFLQIFENLSQKIFIPQKSFGLSSVQGIALKVLVCVENIPKLMWFCKNLDKVVFRRNPETFLFLKKHPLKVFCQKKTFDSSNIIESPSIYWRPTNVIVSGENLLTEELLLVSNRQKSFRLILSKE